MKILDPGHDYELDVLDGDFKIQLTFVKRVGKRYPGNATSYPGTNLQEVLRALIDRCQYVNRQIPCWETNRTTGLLRKALHQLESRAARIHGRKLLDVDKTIIEKMPTCKKCGHIGCKGGCH